MAERGTAADAAAGTMPRTLPSLLEVAKALAAPHSLTHLDRAAFERHAAGPLATFQMPPIKDLGLFEDRVA